MMNLKREIPAEQMRGSQEPTKRYTLPGFQTVNLRETEPIATWLDVQALVLRDPVKYRELLDSFYLLLGQRRLWWQRTADADEPRWKACVREAIVRVATRSGCEPAWLADALDQECFPKTQARIMRIARELLYTAVAA